MILTHCPFDPTPDSTDWDSFHHLQGRPQRSPKAFQGHGGLRRQSRRADRGPVGRIRGTRQHPCHFHRRQRHRQADRYPLERHQGGGRQRQHDGHRNARALIVSWPDGIKKPGRVVDDLVEFSDMLPTLCEVSGAALPKKHPADGASIVPVLQNQADARKKDWIYIWYRGQVMVRNKEYSS